MEMVNYWDAPEEKRADAANNGRQPDAAAVAAGDSTIDLFCVCADLENATNALILLLDGLEREGYQTVEKYDAAAAHLFIMRLPYYLSALRLIIDTLTNMQNDVSRVSG